MRACRLLLTSYSGPALFAASPFLLAASRKRGAASSTQKARSASATPIADGSTAVSLANFAPAIAATWMAAASTKMLQPHHVAPDSRKLAWWRCPACCTEFNKRIDLHVAKGGECPVCHEKPVAFTQATDKNNTERTARCGRGKEDSTFTNGMAPTAANVSATTTTTITAPAVAHRCRPSSAQATLAAENANRIKKSVADGSYLQHQERRNLMPMLAKNYEKEWHKIDADEIVAVSPKLDGIRCVTAYDPVAEKILFFSRAGTLFECCDAKIEPYLQALFESDPALVLDGELYHDSANLLRMADLTSSVRGKCGRNGKHADVNAQLVALFAEETLRVNEHLKLPSTATSKINAARRSKGKAGETGDEHDEEVISFDQLTSAIRTSRDRRTPEHERRQRRLQYHIFDLLYCRECPTAAHSRAFRYRYDYLTALLAGAHRANRIRAARGGRNGFVSSALPYDASTLRLVPSLFCTKPAVEGLLRAAMAVGYEGVMVRRDSLRADTGRLTLPSSCSRSSSNSRGEGSAARSSDRKSMKGGTTTTASALTPDDITAVVMAARDTVQEDLRNCSAHPSRGGGYGFGQRSSTLLKYKLMQDAEFVIVSAVEGKGKWAGSLGAFVCKTRDGKKTFTVTPASTDFQKKQMWATWPTAYKGKALTVQYQELTADGIPRFPVGKAIRGAASGQDWI